MAAIINGVFPSSSRTSSGAVSLASAFTHGSSTLFTALNISFPPAEKIDVNANAMQKNFVGLIRLESDYQNFLHQKGARRVSRLKKLCKQKIKSRVLIPYKYGIDLPLWKFNQPSLIMRRS